MEERIEISIMLDFYGELLTEKQKYFMNLYFNEDLSLAEIAEHNHTSRQAIHDSIKRCHKLLLEYEDKLGLMKKSIKLTEVKEFTLEKIRDLENKVQSKEVLDIIQEIKKEIKDYI